MNDAVAVRKVARPLDRDASDYDGLLSLIGDARFVLIGEASHGTHEFYFDRAEITKRLIAEKGFTVIAIEADWPDAYRVHRYIRGAGTDTDADQALSGFRRFPTWMWRNTIVVEFIEWLRKFNSNLDSKNAAVGFYGMDLYSLHASIGVVLDYLNKVDPEAAGRARRGRPALHQSYEDLFHANGIEKFWIDLRELGQPIEALHESRLERAIGVIYRPETERLSHYFHARMAEQFDAVIHIHETRALEPLERTSVWDEGELPETYPFNV